GHSQNNFLHTLPLYYPKLWHEVYSSIQPISSLPSSFCPTFPSCLRKLPTDKDSFLETILDKSEAHPHNETNYNPHMPIKNVPSAFDNHLLQSSSSVPLLILSPAHTASSLDL